MYDPDVIEEAAQAFWSPDLGEEVRFAHGEDDSISEAEGGVWVKAYLWIPFTILQEIEEDRKEEG